MIILQYKFRTNFRLIFILKIKNCINTLSSAGITLMPTIWRTRTSKC